MYDVCMVASQKKLSPTLSSLRSHLKIHAEFKEFVQRKTENPKRKSTEALGGVSRDGTFAEAALAAARATELGAVFFTRR